MQGLRSELLSLKPESDSQLSERAIADACDKFAYSFGWRSKEAQYLYEFSQRLVAEIERLKSPPADDDDETVCLDSFARDATNASDSAVYEKAVSRDMLAALESIENDDGSIPASIWEMRNKAIAKATGKGIE